MSSPDSSSDATSSTYHVQIHNGNGTVISEHAHVEQHFHDGDHQVSLLDAEQKRYRRAMLAHVRNTWITDFLDKSLYGASMIALRFHEQSDAVVNPWERDVQPPRQSEQSLASQKHTTHIYDAFQGSGKELLILGEPGAGKTTLLLELARVLLDHAKQDEIDQIPVVFNLSSWALKRQSLTSWLIDELNTKYYVPRELGQAWVTKNQLALLLDGLDEVKEEYRAACIEAINTYRQEQGGMIPMVVCSRKADYFTGQRRLQLHSAVTVQPLTHDQIEAYLSSMGEQLEDVRALLQSEPALQELTTIPLMLRILSQAYAGKSVEAFQKAGDSITMQQVFTAYVENMFQRRGIKKRFTQAQTIHGLKWLAQKLAQHSQTQFYIERMQPNWLEGRQRFFYRVAVRMSILLVSGLAAGLGGGLVIALAGFLLINRIEQQQLSYSPFIFMGIAGFLGIVTGGLLHRMEREIKPAEIVAWSWRGMWKSIEPRRRVLLIVLVFVLLFGLFCGFGIGRSEGLINGLSAGLIFGLFGGFLGGSVSEAISKVLSSAAKDKPDAVTNQKQRISLQKRVLLGLVSMLVFVLFFGLFIGLPAGLFYGLINGLPAGLLYGLVVGLVSGLVSGLIGGLVIMLIYQVKTEKKAIESVIWLWMGIWQNLVRSELLRNGMVFVLGFALGFWLLFEPDSGLQYPRIAQ